MQNPYEKLPEIAFWRPAVAQKHFSAIGPLWSPKFDIRPEQKWVTFGSCFAQHIGRALKERGFSWLSTEPPPPELSESEAKRFNYNVFSCRTGNIYTTSLLLQWTRWAVGGEKAPDEVWEKDGRYFDPFRPAIEPGGFASREELLSLRRETIQAFGKAIRQANFFVFTLGLIESWRNKKEQYEYPACPGTIAGAFDPELHEFRYLDIFEVVDSLRAAIELMRKVNPALRIMLTVSPVPLTATNSGRHVMVATTEAKSLLRTAAGQLARTYDCVDYFPSYEIITSPVMQGMFFEPNRREVSPMGVDFVMDHFFACLHQPSRPAAQQREIRAQSGTQPQQDARAQYEIVCEEELLAAFAP